MRPGNVSPASAMRMTAGGLKTKGLRACREISHLEFSVAKSVNQKPMSDLFLSNMVTKSVERKQKWEAAISKGNSSTGL